MRFISPRLICRFSFMLTIAVASLAGARAEEGQTPTPPLAASSMNATRSANGARDAKVPEATMKIGPGDLIEVNVYDEADLHQTIRLNDLGEGSLSFIGKVHLAGLTTEAAEALIATKLKDGNYLLAPRVAVFIREYSTQGVSVIGEVNKPGVYGVGGGQSLLDVLAAAGGTTTLAGTGITIQRAADTSTLTVLLSKDAHQSISSNVRLYPGDKIVIPRAGLVYVLGDVAHGGRFIMENNGKITLLQALAMAGGTTHTSRMHGSRLLRQGPSGYTDVPIELNKIVKGKEADVQLQAEDILYVPGNTLKFAFSLIAPAVMAGASGAASMAVTQATY